MYGVSDPFRVCAAWRRAAKSSASAGKSLGLILRAPIKTGHGRALKQMRAQPRVRKA